MTRHSCKLIAANDSYAATRCRHESRGLHRAGESREPSSCISSMLGAGQLSHIAYVVVAALILCGSVAAAPASVISANEVPGAADLGASPSSPAAGDLLIGGGLGGQVLSVPKGGGTPSDLGTGFVNPSGVAVDAAGDVFVADATSNQVVEIHADGSPQTTVGTGITNPSGVAVDAAGDVFVADTTNKQVVEVHADGSPQTTVGTGLLAPAGVAVDAAGDVFIADTNNGRVVEAHADSSPDSTVGVGLSIPYGVAVDTAGDVFIADSGNGRVVEVHADGSPQSTVGTGLDVPYGVAVDASGDVYIADAFNNQVVKVPADGSPQSTVASGLDMPVGVAVYAPPPTFVASTPPASATVGVAYTYGYTATVTAGEPAATFAVASGTLPPGLTLDATTGLLAGTPATEGSYTFTIETENAANALSATPATITVARGASTPGIGNLYIAGGLGDQVLSVPADGSPQTTDLGGLDKALGVAVFAPPPTIIASTPPVSATVGVAYSYGYTTYTPVGESAPTFALSKGVLPPGLTLDPITGLLVGTPTTAGSYVFAVETRTSHTLDRRSRPRLRLKQACNRTCK